MKIHPKKGVWLKLPILYLVATLDITLIGLIHDYFYI